MLWAEVADRIARGEDEHTELERGLGDLSGVGRATCAFANTGGGVVILGIDDSRAVVGVREDAEKVHERLAGFLQTGLSSPVSARTGRQHEAAGWVALDRGAPPARI